MEAQQQPRKATRSPESSAVEAAPWVDFVVSPFVLNATFSQHGQLGIVQKLGVAGGASIS